MAEAAFTAQRLVRRGYDTIQVDAFVRRINDTLRGRTDRPVTARDLVTARFRRATPLGRGYDCAAVDAFLSEVGPAVIRAGADRAAMLAAAPHHGHIPAQRQLPGWLGRLVNRTP